MNIKIVSIRENTTPGKTLAFLDVFCNDLVIRGCKIVKGSNGDFISMPREQGKDEKYYDIVHFNNILDKTEFDKQVLEQYSKLKEIK